MLMILPFLFGCGSGSGGGGDENGNNNVLPAMIELQDTESDNLNIKGSTGNTAALIRYNVFGSEGESATKGDIEFSLAGPGGGEYLKDQTVKTEDGTVSTILYSGTKSGLVTISATYKENPDVSCITQLRIDAGLPAGEEFGISAEYLNISGAWIAKLEDQITVNLSDRYGNAVPDDTLVQFKTYNTGGYIVSQEVGTVDGVATTTLKSSGTNTQPLQGFLAVTAETQGGADTRVTSIEVSPEPNNHILFVGTNGGGIYKSTDAGQSWKSVSRSTENPNQGQNWIDPYIKGKRAIAVDPDNPNRVYAGTGYLGRGHLYRSLDNGLNWNSDNAEEWNGVLSLNGAVMSVICDGGGSDYVWLGSEGLGALYAEDGEHFYWGGDVTAPQTGSNQGNGSMSMPVLGASTRTEFWTATYTQTEAAATTPVVTPGSGSQVNGNLEITNVSDNAIAQSWTVIFKGSFHAMDNPVQSANGELYVIDAVSREATYTITCTDGTDGSETFSVLSSVDGRLETYEDISQNYDSDKLSFYLIETGNFTTGDVFTFSTNSAVWEVEGSQSGLQTYTAMTGVPYITDDGTLSFSISLDDGEEAEFQEGDRFTFSVFNEYAWVVSGSESGPQNGLAITNVPYTSDNGEATFVITQGTTSFEPGDTFSFSTTASGLGHGKTIKDMVKVSGTHADTAILYAASHTGVYRSTDGGKTWTEPGSFTGDNINCIALHPLSNGVDDILYIGTEDAGVWCSTNSGVTWTSLNDGLEVLQTKDLQIDSLHNRLYVAICSDVSTPAGQIYRRNLNADGSFSQEDWQPANTGLTAYSGTSQELYPIHVLSINPSDSEPELLAGGEGINFYTANTGLEQGTPVWQSSNSGLSNLLMARMPILFSGECSMSIDEEIQGDLVTYQIYVEDYNGNPPLGGSSLTVVHKPEDGEETDLLDIVYPDTYVYSGTWPDNSDDETNNPFMISTIVKDGDKIEFTFTPTCGDASPGCSGDEEIYTYNY
jgi:hypothetical protein